MDPWTRIDPLGEALHTLRMSGVFYCRSEFTTPWGLALPPFAGCMMFHVVTAGQCYLEGKAMNRTLLRPGDLALVPHGEGHRLVSGRGAPTARLFDLPRESLSARYEIIRHGGGGAPATVICAVVRFDQPAARELTRLLPRVIKVDVRKAPETDWVHSTLRLVAAEASHLRPGGDTVITRLADVLVIQAIRSWILRDPAAQTGWLAAIRDKQIGRAIGLIRREPMRSWTVGSLASAVGMSRSAFAARFTRLVGEPAMRYATRWKMYAAATWITEEAIPLTEVASRLGYESESAFSRAFKRLIGVSPGTLRRREALRT